MTEKEFFSLPEFQLAKQNLIEQIGKPKVPYDFILGNLRGGFYLADTLSRSMNIPLKICHISFRDNKLVNDENILNPNFDVRKRYLFVDDLIDSGSTVKFFEGKKNVDFCVLLKNSKIETLNKCYFYKELEQNIWVDFFWETL